MGFRCPVCFKDFAHDKTEWEKHCVENHDGMARDVVTLVEIICKNKNKKKKSKLK